MLDVINKAQGNDEDASFKFLVNAKMLNKLAPTMHNTASAKHMTICHETPEDLSHIKGQDLSIEHSNISNTALRDAESMVSTVAPSKKAQKYVK